MKALYAGALAVLFVGCAPEWAGPYPPRGVPVQGPGRAAPALPADRLAYAVHQRANAARAARGLRPLGWRGPLAGVAGRHSRDMAARSYFDHRSPEGATPTDRARQRGVACRTRTPGGQTRVGVAENLFLSTRYHSYRTLPGGRREYQWLPPDQIAAQAVEAWMRSPGHRANLLDPASSGHGIGVAVSPDHRVYITAVLC